MMTARAPIRDIGPEFMRRLSRELLRIGREADRWTIADQIQAAVDRLHEAEDEEMRRRDARISSVATITVAVIAIPALAFAATCQLM